MLNGRPPLGNFHKQYRYWGLLALIAGLYALMTAWVAPQVDDLTFMGVYRGHNGWSDTPSWQALCDFVAEIRQNDNGRLPNILAPVFLLWWPRWVWCVVFGASAAAIYAFIERLSSSGSRPSWRWLGAAWLAGMAVLPWRDYIYVTDFSLNYVLTSAVALAWLMCAFSWRCSAGWCVLLAFFTGLMHEGFALPLIGGICIWALVNKCRLPGRLWLSLLAMAVGVAVLLTADGVWARAGRELGWLTAPQMAKSIAVYTPIVVFLASWAVFMAFVKAWRSRLCEALGSPLFVVCAFASLVSLVMMIMLRATPHNAWGAQLFAFVDILWLLRRGKWQLTAPVAATAIAAAIAVTACSLWWQHRFYVQHLEICRLMEASPAGTIFYDIIEPQSMPSVLTFSQPTKATWVDPLHYAFLNRQQRPDGRLRMVVPTALRSWRPGMGRPLAGNARAFAYNGCLVTPDTLLGPNTDAASPVALSLQAANGAVLAEDVPASLRRYRLPGGTTAVCLLPLKPLPAGTIKKCKMVNVKW